MTTLYKIVLSGNGIVFDNYGSPEPVIGFIATRLIRAESQALAIALAKRNILVHWNQSFNADRKIGLPKLHLEAVMTVHPLFRRKPKHDYYFFVSEDHKTQLLGQLTQPKRWWFQRRS